MTTMFLRQNMNKLSWQKKIWKVNTKVHNTTAQSSKKLKSFLAKHLNHRKTWWCLLMIKMKNLIKILKLNLHKKEFSQMKITKEFKNKLSIGSNLCQYIMDFAFRIVCSYLLLCLCLIYIILITQNNGILIKCFFPLKILKLIRLLCKPKSKNRKNK